jgi:DegV family protein with EDD domain
LSGTIDAARTAAERITSVPITVVDSKTLTAAMGLLLLEAAEAIERGCTHEEVVGLIEDLVPRSRILVGARTLKYFIRGGRISPVQGVLGRLLNVKPIITVDRDGKGDTFGRAYNRRGILRNIEQELSILAGEERIHRYAVVHSAVPDEAAAWIPKVVSITGISPDYTIDISPVIGVHAGPGALGVCLLENRPAPL